MKYLNIELQFCSNVIQRCSGVYKIFLTQTNIFINCRERESHTAHLKNMEAELDAQVARIERQEREKARLETEYEKKELEGKLQTELDELKAQLKIFQKVRTTQKAN